METHQAKTQLIAHDKEVYDLAFAPSTDVFASAGADGSVRMFDLRSLEHSTIIYESPELVPLLRLCWTPDQQLLTRDGFRFIDDVFDHLTRHPTIDIASYSIAAQTLTYHPITIHDVVYQDYDGPIVDIIQGDEAANWDETSDASGHAATKEGEDDPSTGSHVCVSVTPDHNMYVGSGRYSANKSRVQWKKGGAVDGFRTVKARELLSEDSLDALRFMASAKAGVDVSAEGSAAELPFTQALALTTSDQVDAFLELYGCFLGSGTMQRGMTVGESDHVELTQIKQHDEEDPLEPLLGRLGLVEGVDYHVHGLSSGSTRVYAIVHRAWSAYFDAEYGAKQTLSVQWFWTWVWRLSRPQLRLLVRGLCMADGRCVEDTGAKWIFTPSIHFRDALVVALLHGGYSAHFTHTAGAVTSAVRGHAAQPGWVVRFSEEADCAQPIIRPAEDVRQRPYKGKVFCVTLPERTDHLVMVRKAVRDEATGCVTKASRPLVMGQCWNKHDHNYLATFLMEQQQVVILDIRAPSVPVAELAGHSQCVNTLAWAPHSSCHICFGEDTRVLTNHGFKFLHEIEAMLASGVHVEYACYDVSRRQLVYGPGKLVLPRSTPKELVSFSHDSNHLELKVTADHEVYCQVGTIGPAGHTQWPLSSVAEGRKQISAAEGR